MCKYSYIFQEKVQSLNKDELCDWFHEFMTVTLKTDFHKICDKKITNLKNMIRGMSGNSDMKIDDIDYDPGISKFKWDTKRKGQGIKVYNNGESIFLNESCYAFRSIVANEPFTEGIHYFEIIADKRTESELKIGYTKNPDFNYDTSFSDYPFGWAFYGVGQLRHDNNAGGENYGKKFKKYGTLGVFLDMNKGIISFSLDKEYFGIAYQSEELKTGPLYPAVSLLHVGGCTLQCGIPAKPCFFGEN
jgi:E3 ubiquitin-protein ligase NRDP1